jgi:predicted nucleic acid-binding protein
MIIDASVILSAFFPDEAQVQAQTIIRDHVSERVRLVAPTLLLYEVTNAVLQAMRRERITAEQGEDILASFEGLSIALEPVTWQQMLSLAQRFDRSVYDAAYLALAEATGQPLTTGDRRMYNAVRERLDWVQWIGDYRGTG